MRVSNITADGVCLDLSGEPVPAGAAREPRSCGPTRCGRCARTACWPMQPTHRPMRSESLESVVSGPHPRPAPAFCPHEPSTAQTASPTPPQRRRAPRPARRPGDRRGRGPRRRRRSDRLRRRRSLRHAEHRRAAARRPGSQLRGLRRRRQAPRLHRVRRAAHARCTANQHPQDPQAGHGRDRGPALLPAQGRRLRGHRPRRRSRTCASGKTVQGGSTITMQLVRNLYTGRARADLPAQDPRGQARRGARERAHQVVDPRQLPQHRALRHRRRSHGDRRRRPPRGCSSTSRVSKLNAARGRDCSPACRRRPRSTTPSRSPERRDAPQRGARQDGASAA